ncbi:MAG: carboxypeptidase regulatory-like domain-containing protein [Planctomycetes bacterium]|nr:carboxypeptidase regulatory-like domain-containing protein [Planctomycetota bacterium]
MRPIHALILVVVLALGVAGLAFFLANDAAPHEVAEPAKGASTSATTPPAPANLSAPDDVVEHATDEAHGARASGATEAARPAPGALLLRGRLVDARGKPVTGARVLADAGGLDEVPIDLDGEEAGPWLQRIETKSDGEGRFALQPPSKSQVRLAARAAGFAPWDQTLPLAAGAKDLGDVVMEDSVILEGRVVDSAHRGVADAKLYRLREQGGGLVIFGARAGGILLSTTDAQGRFRIDRLRAGPYKLAIESEEHPDARSEGQTERPGQVVANLEIVLEDGSEIRGRVTGAPAELLPKLVVRASVRPGGLGSIVSDLGEDEGLLFGAARKSKVAKDGAFHLRGLKKGQTYRLVARDSDDDFLGQSRSASVQATAGDSDVVLTYRAETALVFQVVDAVDQKPIEELTVSAGMGFLVPSLDPEGRPIRRYPEGRVRYASFQGRPQPGQKAELSITASGYRTYTRDDLVLAEGRDTDLGVLRLERAPVVRIAVVDGRTGAPIVGAQVGMNEYEPPAAKGEHRIERSVSLSMGEAEEGGDLGSDLGGSARTDKNGKAKLTSLPGKTVQFRVTHKEHAPWLSEPITLPAGEDVEQKVKLGPGGAGRVVAQDAQAKALPGVDIEHRGAGREMPFLLLGGASDERTDAQGLALFEHLMPGPHRFRVGESGGNGVFFGNGGVMRMATAISGGPEEKGWTEVVVVEGETVEVKLVAPERSTLAGRVTEAGRPLAGAKVELVADEEGALAMPFFGGGPNDQTDTQGGYSVADVKVGRYRLQVTHGTRAMAWEAPYEVRAGENRFDVDLPIAILEGQVKGPDGKPLAGVRVQAERAQDDEGGGVTRQTRMVAVIATDDGEGPEIAFGGGAASGPSVLTDADGRYKLRGVLADVDLVVKAKAKDVQPGQSAKVRVAADQTRGNVDLKLETGGALEVTLEKSTGEAARSCMVMATYEDKDGPEPRHEFSGPKGKVELTGLKPGRWRVHVDSFNAAPGQGERASIPDQTIEVLAGKTAKARFQVP